MPPDQIDLRSRHCARSGCDGHGNGQLLGADSLLWRSRSRWGMLCYQYLGSGLQTDTGCLLAHGGQSLPTEPIASASDMRPAFQPYMVNGPFDDPVLYVDFLFEKRALLFDSGNLRGLAARKLLRVSDLFVSHAHMDHFADFDWLLRLRVGRARPLRMFGPIGFIARVHCKLEAYSWNLVQNYDEDFIISVTELDQEGEGKRATFRCRNAFQIEAEEDIEITGGVLVDDAAFCVRGAILDHSLPVLAFCIEEKQHVNVWKNRLAALGLPVGPWLHELKRAVLESRPDNTQISVTPGTGPGRAGQTLPLAFLKEQVLQIVPGQRIGYVVDIEFSESNCRRAADLLSGCDLLFIETAFLQDDARIAAQRKHLTAHQAGLIAARARAKCVIPIHFSPRYANREHTLRAEAHAAFQSHLA